MSPRRLLEGAIALFGSEAKLGSAIGFTQNAVHQAKKRGSVSWEMACVIDHVTRGRFDRFALCPERAVLSRRINGLRKVSAPKRRRARRPATRRR
jgi:hypothetical protein